MLMRSEFRILPVTLYELFWNIVVIFCLVFSLVDRRRESETAFCDSAGPAPPCASHMTRCRVSGLVTHARALHLVTLLDKRLAGWSVCPTVPQNPVSMTRRMTSNRQDDRLMTGFTVILEIDPPYLVTLITSSPHCVKPGASFMYIAYWHSLTRCPLHVACA